MNVSFPPSTDIVQIKEFSFIPMSIGFTLFFSDVSSESPSFKKWCDESLSGLFAGWEDERKLLIWVNGLLDTKSRHQTIVHEVSHLVDYLFESTGVVYADTEVRAYFIDFIYGLVYDRTVNKPSINKGGINIPNLNELCNPDGSAKA